ncbi:MAG: hypothetical protein IT427_17865 [Pirellulales bacterium]|nr:hypothetical protein [Pirellulales bacterium]
MSRLARGGTIAGGFAVWLSAAALLAQSGGANNPLRGNSPQAGNQPNHSAQPGTVQPMNQGAQVQALPPVNQAGSNGQPNRAGQPNEGQGQPQGTVLQNGQPARPQQLQVQPPFVLSQQAQTEVNALLAEWEAQSNNIKTFSCSFSRATFNPAFTGNDNSQASAQDLGQIKYAAPDRGMFRVDETYVFVKNPKSGEYDKTPGGDGEHWTCSGTSIYNVNIADKSIDEYPLPKELQGKAITEGPLPFVFGAKAAALKERYFIRDITPPQEKGKTVWLQVVPKFRRDAQNFQYVEVILTKADMLPYAMNVVDPGATTANMVRTVYTFNKHSVNSPLQAIQGWFTDFSKPTKFGYKHVVKQPPTVAPQQAQPPTQAKNSSAEPSAASRQAVVPQTSPRR